MCFVAPKPTVVQQSQPEQPAVKQTSPATPPSPSPVGRDRARGSDPTRQLTPNNDLDLRRISLGQTLGA